MKSKIAIPGRLIELWRKLTPAWQFSLVSVTVMRVFYTLWAFFFVSSFSLAVQNQVFFGEPVVSVFDLQSSRSYAYSRFVEGQILTFQKYDRAHLIDESSGSIWNMATGECISGLNAGKKLSPSNLSTERLFPYYGVNAHVAPSLSIWQRFDANWYLAIAQRGYGTISGDVHFPPLYPVLIQWVSFLLRDDLLAGMLISQLALYVLVKLMYDLFVEWGGDKVAPLALFFFLIFPTSFFLFSAYTESLFMIAAIFALRDMRERKWHWAGFWIFIAILLRLQGVALLLPLAWNIFQTRLKNIRWPDLLLAGASPAAAVGVYLWLRAGVGESSVIPLNEANLHARMVFPWDTFLYSVKYILAGLGGYIDVLNLIALIAFIVLQVMYWKRMPVEYALYAAASIILFAARWVDTQPLNSMIRYLITVFPVFFFIGRFAQNKWVNRLMFLGFLGLNLFLCAQFFLWGWVA